MKRRRKILLGGVALMLVLGLLGVVAHYRAKFALEKFKAQLRAQGEKLSIDELIPAEPIGQANGAKAFLDAFGRLGSFDSKLGPSPMKMLHPGRGRIAWQQATLPTDDAEDIWPALKAQLQESEPDMDDLRKAIGRPALSFQVDYQGPFEALPPHLAPLKSASQWLSAAAVMAMHDQDTAKAFACLKWLIALPVHWRGECLPISQLVRIAIVAIGAQATWEALHYPHWTEEQLAQLQADWALLETVPQMERALAMNRAMASVEYALARDSLDRLDALLANVFGPSNPLDDLAEAAEQLIDDPLAGFESLIDRFPRRWIWKWWSCYGDEMRYLQTTQSTLDVARQLAGDRPAVSLLQAHQYGENLKGSSPRGFLFSRLRLDGVFHPGLEKAALSKTQCRLVVTAIALKRFERRSGQLPSDLTALVPGFLSTVPLDPMDSQPLRYRPSTTNSFLLYSVGLDGVDDHGDARPKGPGWKVHYWMFCKDCVWPLPASADEVREHDAKLKQQRAKNGR